MIRNNLLKVWRFLQRPISLFLSVVGVVATLYFGLSAPGWIEGQNTERVWHMNQELIETVEDLVLNNQITTVTQITAQVCGKELRYNMAYPYSIEDLVVQVQEDIMETVFLPLEQKVQLIKTLENIKKENSHKETKEKERKALMPLFLNFISGLLATLAVVIAANGISALIARNKKEQDAVLGDRLETVKDDLANSIRGEVEYKLTIESILRELDIPYYSSRNQKGYDFGIEVTGNQVFVGCNQESNMLYHPYIQMVISTAKMCHNPFLLVTNTSRLTATASDLLATHNAEYKDCQIYLIRGDSDQGIGEQIKLALNKINSEPEH